MYTTLISVPQLQHLVATGTPLLVFDCSYDLMQPAAGEQQFLQSHIPGAHYTDLSRDLSAKGAPDAASGGRHPLPAREKFAAWLGGTGLTNGMQAVVYDRNGCNYCARLWWMLKWCGHEAVAVLDGGLQAWQGAGLPLQGGLQPPRPATVFALAAPAVTLVTANQVARQLNLPRQTLLDARAPARFRGEMEPLDPVAGHIPGALNRPFSQNLGADGLFKPAATLRAEFDALLAGRDPATVVHHCGSGVSALPNLLAMELAGLGSTALFAGSWSEWCDDPKRPVATG
ncbi:MAG: sulfurtransferase [Burkholderiales bacterium]